MSKRKTPEHARDCVTLAEKIAFSLMVRAETEALGDNPWSVPSDFCEILDKYDDPACPWSHPEWATSYARREEEKERVLRSIERAEKRQTNRTLYRKA